MYVYMYVCLLCKGMSAGMKSGDILCMDVYVYLCVYTQRGYGNMCSFVNASEFLSHFLSLRNSVSSLRDSAYMPIYAIYGSSNKRQEQNSSLRDSGYMPL